MLNYKKLALGLALPIATVALFNQAASAETLNTHDFQIKITRSCSEGYVTCNNVTYYGRDLNTGRHIRLIGKTVNSTCADGVTPCRFLGYEFRNSNYLYKITADGKLLVYKNGRLILDQQGTFQY